MHIDLREGEIWERACVSARAILQVPETHSLRLCQGAVHALYETIHSLVQLFPHKKSIAVVGGATPHFEPLLPYFFRETFQIQQMLNSQIESPEGYVSALNKDTLFVLLCDDHAVTDRLYDYAKIEALLAEKKIYCIRLSHSQHLYQRTWSGAFSSMVYSVSPDLAICVSGARIKSLPIMASHLSWSLQKVTEELQSYSKSTNEVDEKLVKKIESSLPKGMSPLLKAGTARIYDRACIVMEKVNSEAVQKKLAAALGHTIQAPGYERDIESLNPCRWSQLGEQAWWQDPALTSEEECGGLMLSVQILKHPQFQKIFETVYQEILSEQA